jgi:hypothetical protein
MMINYKIISWDVGIKNLAYCMLEKDMETGKFTVLKWDKINIVDSDLITCCGIKQNSDVCGKKASLVGNINGTTKYYCGAHKSQYKPFDDNWEQEFMVQTNAYDKCSYTLPKKGTVCNKLACFTSDGSSYCKTHAELIKNTTKKNAELKKIKRTKATSTNPDELCEKMYAKLDAIPNITDINEVLIENQPTLKNPSMKTVACMLFSYFILRGKLDKTTNKISKIRFISPSNKLKVDADQIKKIVTNITDKDRIYTIILKLLNKYLETTDTIKLDNYIPAEQLNRTVNLILTYLMDKKTTSENIASYDLFKEIKITTDKFIDVVKKVEKDDGNYEITKLLAVKYTELLLESQDSKWIAQLNGAAKKDDLCDALLQGYYNMYHV